MSLAKFISFAKESFSIAESPPAAGEITYSEDTGKLFFFNGAEVRVTYALMNDRSDMDK